MDLLGIPVEGLSIGGVETCLILPTLHLAFDLGGSSARAISIPTVCFTHSHVDHMAGVIWHAAMRSMQRLAPPRYYVPRECHAALLDLFAVWRRLDCGQLACEVIPIGPGERVPLQAGWSLEPFRSPHRIPCQGYALYHEKSVLREELRGLPEAEIRRLRVDLGAEVTRRVETCELAFTGDTLIDVVEREPVVRRARRLLMEATFLDDRVSVAEARSKGHVHLYEVAERAALFENELLCLTHFSTRYQSAEVLAAMERVLPAELKGRTRALLQGRS